jgi:MFS family permease
MATASQTPENESGPKPGIISVLSQWNYGVYTAGSTISLFGLWAHRLAAAWLAWELTHSSFWVGMVVFADLIPTLFLTPFAGVLADRYDRRHLAIISQVMGMVQAIVLGWMYLDGQLATKDDIWWLVGWTLFLGIAWALNTAARLSMVPNLVEHNFIPPAVALNSAIFNLGRVVGPVSGALIIDQWNVGIAFIFNAVTFVFFIAALMVIRPVRTEEKPAGGAGMLAQSLEGIKHAARHPGIGPAMVLLIAMAMGGKALLEVLPEFADEVFARGASGLGELTAASGVGGLIAAMWLAQRGSVKGLTRITIIALLITGLSIFGFVATAWYPLALFSIFVLGVTGIYGGTATQTLMQHAVEGSMRGRVMSLYGVIHRGAPAIGALAMGAAADVIGIRWSVAAGGVLCLATWVWMLKRSATASEALEKEHID